MHLTILGCYSATPRTFNNPTAQVLEINNQLFLIDCGEGTQVALRRSKVKFSRIKRIFISHLHGDHFYGLIGLISTFGLLKRDTPLHIYGPKGIKDICLLQIKHAKTYTNYELHFHELDSTESELIYEDEKVVVRTIPLSHRIYTNGYLFSEKITERKLNLDKLQNLGIEPVYYGKIKKGGDATLEDGTLIKNKEITFDAEAPKSYAFCSDTRYKPDIVPIIKGATALYHESTFQEDHIHLTDKTGHSTAKEAGQIAQAAKVKHLILGHYSTRYSSLDGFKTEAQTAFDTVHLAEDGKSFTF